jgi:diacylglycerol O-acyltransferase / wax synthase
MHHLSGLDATFLHIESPEMPMHVGSLNVLDLPPGYEGDFYEDAKAHMMARIHLAKVLTRKLALMPFDLSNPVWIDDHDIDFEHHVRHVTLPKPGSNRQLQQYVGRLHSTLLDRSRPLWEFFIIDGLKSGQVALYTKAHHAAIDGQAGVAVAKAIFDFEPTGRVVKPPQPHVRRNDYQLGIAELAGAALRNTVLESIKLVKTAPTILRAIRDVVVPDKDENGKRNWRPPSNFRLFGPRTLLNVAITNQRSFAGRTISLAETKMIGKTFGATLNDVVMATTAGAIRRYLQEYENLPATSLIAAVPVSLREAGDTSSNNQVSMSMMTLATDIADPVERLQVIHAAGDANKALMGRVKGAIPTDFPMLGAPWLISSMASLFGRSRAANVLPPLANIVISNVPGSPIPLYFAGARMVSYYPVSIAVHSMALNVTVQSYAGRLDYGLIACRRALPDVNDLGDYLLAEHQALLARAQQEAAKLAVADVIDPPTAAASAPATKRLASLKTAATVPVKVAKAAKAKLVASGVRTAASPRSRSRTR